MSASPHAPAVVTPLALLAALLVAPYRNGAARLLALRGSRELRARRPWPVGLFVASSAVVGLSVAGPAGAVVAAGMAFDLFRGRARRAADAAEAARAGELADALHRITDELRVGAHPAAALAGVTADGSTAAALLAPAAHAARWGDDVVVGLRHGAAGLPGGSAELDRVAAAWSLADRHGVPLAELLTEVHEDLRWRSRFAASVHAQLAGPRATAGVLTALPALGLALGQLVGADPFGVLRSGVLGQVLLVTGFGLLAAGRGWTAQILRRAVPR